MTAAYTVPEAPAVPKEAAALELIVRFPQDIAGRD